MLLQKVRIVLRGIEEEKCEEKKLVTDVSDLRSREKLISRESN